MHSKLRRAAEAARLKATTRLERLIDAMAEDLAEASDEEVLQACADLGMNPEMRGSAAFFGLKGPSIRLDDFFDLEELRTYFPHIPESKLQRLRRDAPAITAQSRASEAHPGKAETSNADEEDGDEE